VIETIHRDKKKDKNGITLKHIIKFDPRVDPEQWPSPKSTKKKVFNSTLI